MQNILKVGGLSLTSVFKIVGDGSIASTDEAAAIFAAAHVAGTSPSAGMPTTHRATVNRSWQSSTGFSYPFYNLVIESRIFGSTSSAFLCKLRELETKSGLTPFSWITYDRPIVSSDSGNLGNFAGIRKRAEIFPGFYVAWSIEERCFLALLPEETDNDVAADYAGLLSKEIDKLNSHGFKEFPVRITFMRDDMRAQMMELAFPSRKEAFDRAVEYFTKGAQGYWASAESIHREVRDYIQTGESIDLTDATTRALEVADYSTLGAKAVDEWSFMGAQNIAAVDDILRKGIKERSLPAGIRLHDIMILKGDTQVIYVFANANNDSKLSCIAGGRSDSSPELYFRNCVMEYNPTRRHLRHEDYRGGRDDFASPEYHANGAEQRVMSPLYDANRTEGVEEVEQPTTPSGFNIPASACVWTAADKQAFRDPNLTCTQMCDARFFMPAGGYQPSHTMIIKSCPADSTQSHAYITSSGVSGEDGKSQCIALCNKCGRENAQLIVDEDPNGEYCKNKGSNAGGQ